MKRPMKTRLRVLSPAVIELYSDAEKGTLAVAIRTMP